MRSRFNLFPVLLTALLAATLLLSTYTVVLRAASAATLVSYTESSTDYNVSSASKATAAAVSWNSGDIIVYLALSEDASGGLQLPTATGLTFANQQTSGTAGTTCGARIDTAVAGSTSSSVVTGTQTPGSGRMGFSVWVFRNSTGVGNSAEQHTTGKTVGLTPAASNADIVWGICDFNADGALTATPTATNTRKTLDDGTRYSVGVFDLVDTAATTYGGVTTGTTGPFSLVVLEIKNDGSGGAAAKPKHLLLGVGDN